jgi:hypothetical protein
MKNKLTYLLLLPLAVATGCLKKPKIINPGDPLGTYTGQFTGIHNNSSIKDTLKANLQLLLSSDIGFAVSGDTSSVHAGSTGSFSYTTDTITFNDITTSKKVHLIGSYIYSWDGTNLTMIKSNDTMQYIYRFKRVSIQQ